MTLITLNPYLVRLKAFFLVPAWKIIRVVSPAGLIGTDPSPVRWAC